jgi:hypothetical protein
MAIFLAAPVLALSRRGYEPRPQYVAQQHVLRTCSGFRLWLSPQVVTQLIGKREIFFSYTLKKIHDLPMISDYGQNTRTTNRSLAGQDSPLDGKEALR